MKILITGGSGYLGSVIIRHLLNEFKECQITVLDNLMYNQTSLLQYAYDSRFKFIYGDVREIELLKKLVEENEVIIPLAAIVGFPACDKDSKLAWDVNYRQIENIIRWSAGKKILYPNTNSGYGIGVGQTECTEESPLNPISVYGESKCAAEKLLLEFTDSVVVRLATVFGCSQRMRMDLLVNEFVYKAMTDKYITVFEQHFKRNFIHIEDVARVFIFLLKNFDTHKGEVFNIGLSDANLSKAELLDKIKEYIPNFAVTYSDFYQDPDKRDYIVSNKKIEKTGWQPIYNLDDGIKQLINSYKIVIPKASSEFRNGFPLGYAKSL